jgi:hypothetical protein
MRPVITPVTIEDEALRALAVDLDGATDGAWRFFRTLFDVAEPPTTVDELVYALAVDRTMLCARFHRAGLGPVGNYVRMALLIRAARALELSTARLPVVATTLGWATAGSFAKSVQGTLGISMRLFRSYYTGRVMLDRFRMELVVPHADLFRGMDPLAAGARRRDRRRA